MNVESLLSQRQIVALLGSQGCILSPHTLVIWRRDPKIGFPQPTIRAARALLYDRGDVLKWFAAFKQSPRYRAFLRRIALRCSPAVREQIAPAKPAKGRKVRAHAEAA